jgi:FixJ family two-component response regulator
VIATHPRNDGAETATVAVVDDDISVREALGSLLRSAGFAVALYESAAELRERGLPDDAGCLILDVRLQGLSGLQVQSELSDASVRVPIVFITGHGDIPMSVRAMKAGAVDFLTKPFRDQDLLDAVTAALRRDRKRRDDEAAVRHLRSLYASLTQREQEVMAFVVEGLLNKQIAAKMGLSEITVKVHRGNVMRKMGARSVASLVRIATTLSEG